MKQFMTILIILLSSIITCGQLTKGNWLVGGTGNFLTSKNTYTSITYSSTSDRIDIKISPSIGYFFVDKIASGLRISYSKFKDEVNGPGGGYSNINRFEFGPFVRYYFLKSENQYNILTDLSYQYGLYRFKPTKGNINTLSLSAGPVIYFNTVVGLEFLLGYYNRKEVIKQNGDITNKQSGFQIGIGLQIHLEH